MKAKGEQSESERSDDFADADASRLRAVSSYPPEIFSDTPSVGSLPSSSSTSTARDQRELKEGVRLLAELQHASVLRIVGRVLLYGALPMGFTLLFVQLRQSFVGTWFWVELGGLLCATVAARQEALTLRIRKPLVAVSLLVATLGAQFHFGPFFGAGVVAIGTVLICAVLLTRTQAFVAGVVFVVGLAADAAVRLFFPHLLPPGEMTLSQGQWLRVMGSAIVGIFGVLFIFQKVQQNLWRSLEKEISGRLRERRLVAQREKVLRGAAATQRLESLGRLAGGVAHDFNNALVVIQCGIETLRDGLDEHERREVLEELTVGVDRAASTARQLLSFAKRNVEDIGEANPKVVLDRLEKESVRLLPAHVELEVHAAEDTPRVALSEGALEQMVHNLVNNSVDALQLKGGKITVTSELEESTGGLLLSVADDGPGIPSEVAEQVFEPFFTTKGDRANGLGLATVWGIVNRHGGEVTLDTEEGRGTRVALHIPANLTSASQSISVASLKVPVSSFGTSARVLILEDEPPVRAALRRILKALGFEVVEASTVSEARAELYERDFALLISDGVVPDGGVGAFIYEFQARQRGAPVILCSGYLEEDLVLDGIARGRCTYLAKPFSAAELAALVNRLVWERSEAPKTLNSR